MFKKGKEKIPYGLASSGEKTILDIHMLEKLIPNSGLLILDEFLRNLDEQKLDIVTGILSDMNVGTVILTSHAGTVGNFYNKLISISLDENEHTQIKCS
jgi:ABC-type multidrug transport system ATPase subunit